MAQIAVAVVAGTAAAAAEAAPGAVTIGSSLANPPNGFVGGEGTFANVALPAASQAPGGLRSPVNGVVNRWRIRAGTPAVSARLRVVKPLGGSLFTGAGTSETVTPTQNAISTFTAQLPISIGDLIGVDIATGTSFPYRAEVAGALTYGWFPTLADSGPGRAPDTPYQDAEGLVNADIEPTSAFTILKTKPKKGGKVQVTVDLPNPGTLLAGDKSAKFAAAAAAKKKAKFLKRASAQVSAPGQVTLIVKGTKLARSLLADRGRLKAKLKLAFTPTGGTASTQVRKTKLKP